MKNWAEQGYTVLVSRPASARTRFLTAGFVTLVAIAGFDTIFPSLKQHFIPTANGQSRSGVVGPTFESFKWSQIEPKEHFDFHECFEDFQCAKLSLPLDYFNGTYPDETISVAIVKLPARVPISDPRYGGPILINPGGPGGPGALFALSTAKSLRWVVDAASDPASAGKDARFFDIIGFDPRGIGETEPAARCMSDPAAAWSWRLREAEEGILSSSDAALGRLWAMTHAFGSSCALAADQNIGPDIKQYMTTASVARDMLEIVERHAEYVAQQAAQATHNTGKRSSCRDASLTEYVPGRSKLQYWGFSYGTFLGSTFASMFPDRIGLAVLDGVVNEWDYRHSLGNGSLVDNEKAMNSFYSYCQLSGSKVCPLGNGTTTTAQIKERAERILKSLYHNPLILASANGPEVITYSDIKSVIFSSIYQPRFGFDLLGHLLPEIELGRGKYIDWLSQPFHIEHTLSCGANGTVNPGISPSGDVPTYAILCSDSVQQDVSLDDFVENWHLMQNMSSAAGDIWAMLSMKCAGWKIRANYNFEGEFGGTTSHPILFVSNTADPVTPLRSGRIMHSRFSNSGLLINDQAGHCSFSALNYCAIDNIKQYFQSGALPAKDTLCVPPTSAFSLNSTDPDSPFYDPSLQVGTSGFVDSRDVRLEQERMHAVAHTLQRVVLENDAFAFGGLVGSSVKARRFRQLAASKYWG